ncbi:hypothetical protein AYY21_12960 [Photobacterium aquimaris]|nr:hypothetical protein AYY21_12960 [Photobacterium aquimaris]
MTLKGKIIDNTEYNLVGIYENSRDTICDLVVQDVLVTLKATINLVDNCYNHYRDTHLRLSRGSVMGVSQHFTLHCEKIVNKQIKSDSQRLVFSV